MEELKKRGTSDNGYKPTVVFDFDGVIHSYASGWQGADVIPDPVVPGIGDAIDRLRERGYMVVVVSTRCSTHEGMEAVMTYLDENGIIVDGVLAEKPPALCYVDDRAICFKWNAGKLVHQVENFKTWLEDPAIQQMDCTELRMNMGRFTDEQKAELVKLLADQRCVVLEKVSPDTVPRCEDANPLKVRINTHGGPMPVSHGEWIDLYASEDTTMKTGDFKIIPLGVSMELPKGYYANILPRSSTCKNHGIIMANSMAVIENSYCGDNDIWGFPAVAVRDTHIPKGTRICQFRLVKKAPEVSFDQVESLGNPDRGGYGSTGR